MKVGVIGCGNMATAMLGGILQKGLVARDEVTAADPNDAARERFAASLGVHTTPDNRAAASGAAVVILAVKPNQVADVAGEISGVIDETAVIVTMAAGKTLSFMEELFGSKTKIVRLMPNTPALVGEGMTGFSPNENVTEEETEMIRSLLASFGRAELVREDLLDAVMGASGSAPAYAFLLIEAIADACARHGLPRAQALTFAAQAVLGSAKMVLETGRDPADLTEMVCSPGGTTIEAVQVFREKDLHGIVGEAVDACIAKAKVL